VAQQCAGSRFADFLIAPGSPISYKITTPESYLTYRGLKLTGVTDMIYQRHAGAVRRFAIAMKIGAWLQGLPGKLTPAPFRLLQISSAFWQSRALYVATRLDIAGVLGEASLSAEDIAAAVNASPDAIARLLRLLAAMGIFEETTPRVYRNNKLSNHLRADKRNNIRAMILMHHHDAMSRPWFEQLERGVREGVPPFSLSHGMELFADLDRHSELDTLFAQAMDSVEALSGDAYATDFDWSRFERIIDIGGSRGSKSLTILKHHPGLAALVVDRAQVINEARQYWSAQSTPAAERMRFEIGDILGTLPAAQSARDIYLLAAVIHGFDADTAIVALRNLADACGNSGARIALLENVLPEQGADLFGAASDMQMFMGTRGRERSLTEWSRLFARSGLILEEVVGLRSFVKILVLKVGN